MNLKTAMVLAISAALAAPVAAQQAPRSFDPKDNNPAAAGATMGSFEAMDRNKDGYISRDEARDAPWNTRFSELDKDNDGRLSAAEFAALQDAAGATVDKDARSPSTTGGMGGSVGPAGTQSGSSTSGIGDKPGEKQ